MTERVDIAVLWALALAYTEVQKRDQEINDLKVKLLEVRYAPAETPLTEVGGARPGYAFNEVRKAHEEMMRKSLASLIDEVRRFHDGMHVVNIASCAHDLCRIAWNIRNEYKITEVDG